jgi:hypothetical protein
MNSISSKVPLLGILGKVRIDKLIFVQVRFC